MRALVQRVASARVSVAGETVGEIGRGLVAFVGAGKGDGESDVSWLANKVVGLRVFENDDGKMARSLVDVGGELLVVSQFTLYGDVSRGLRPSFDAAMPPDEAERLVARFVDEARARGVRVATGRFRADMRVLVDNDGPVTIAIDSSRGATA